MQEHVTSMQETQLDLLQLQKINEKELKMQNYFKANPKWSSCHGRGRGNGKTQQQNIVKFHPPY